MKENDEKKYINTVTQVTTTNGNCSNNFNK